MILFRRRVPDQPPSTRIMRADLRVIEPQQFEASFSYRIGYNQEPSDRTPRSYMAESYLFFPPQMKINPSSYPLVSFFRDMKSYINFRIPKLSFKEIIGLTDNPHRSPLKKIRRELTQDQGAAEATEDKQIFIRQEARVFGSAFYNFVMRKTKKIERQREETILATNQFSDQLSQDIFEKSVTKIHTIFREWQRLADSQLHPKPASLQTEFDLVDEYIVFVMRDFLLASLEALKDFRIARRVRTRIQNQLRVYLRALRIYAHRCDYFWPEDQSTEEDLENFQYRRGLLKRKMWSSLYLDPRVKPLFTLQKQAGAMVAAGAAAVWAFMAELAIRTSPGFRNGLSPSIESGTFILISAFALAYILKDRIKELGRGYFKGGLFGRLPDSNNKIVYPKDSSGQKDIAVGTYQEKARYARPQKLPDDIQTIVDAQFPDEEDEVRSIIHYTQRISLREKPIRQLKRKIRAVYSFYRLNIGTLLGPLDRATEPGLVVTQDLHVTQRELPKVYHINLIVKLYGKIPGKTPPIYRWFRIILNKEGIVRIENQSHKLSPLA
jgi:hypothetical protein